MLVGVMCTMTSCLKDENDTVTLNDDAAISSITFGTLTKTTITVSESGDTTTTSSTFAGSSYPIYINQRERLIYNPDSLPLNTDMKKITFNVNTINAGLPYLVVDSIYYYIESAIQFDLTKDRKLVTFSSDGLHKTEYTIRIAAHQEKADTFTWAAQPVVCTEIAALKGLKALHLGNKMMAVGTDGGATKIMAAETNGSIAWVNAMPAAALSENTEVVCDGDHLFVLDHQSATLYTTADGNSWDEYAAPADIRMLLGASCGHVYALNDNDDIMRSADGFTAWTIDDIDASEYKWTETDPVAKVKQYLPKKNVSSCSFITGERDELATLIVVGNRNVDTDTTAVVWNRYIDTEDMDEFAWNYQAFGRDSRYKLPKFDNLSVAAYGNFILAIGKGSNRIYCSQDKGLTWKSIDGMALPDAFDTNCNAVIAADDKTVWVICEGTGAVWRGRMHSVSWDNPQKFFDK